MTATRVSDSEFDAAKRIMRLKYHEFVDNAVSSVVHGIFDDEITDAESLDEYLRQDVDNRLTYTADQFFVLGAEESSTSEGLDELQDLGGTDGDLQTLPGQWAFLTLMIDVRAQLEREGIDVNDFDREDWIRGLLEGKHGDDEYRVEWDKFLERGGDPGFDLSEA